MEDAETIARRKARLIQAVVEDQARLRDLKIPFQLDVASLMCIVGCLQVAMRHPANTGGPFAVTREFVDQTIERMRAEGAHAIADMMELGDNQEYDASFAILENGLAIKCLHCGMTSHNPNDVAFRYCGNCHRFHDAQFKNTS